MTNILNWIKGNFFKLTSIFLPILTAYLASQYSIEAFYKQKKFENRQIAYTKLVATGKSYSQARTLFYDNQLELYYLMKALKLKPYPDDSINIIRRQDWDFEYMKQQNIELKEFIEMVVLAQVSFEVDKELQLAIDSVIEFAPYNLQQYPKETTLNDFDYRHLKFKAEMYADINKFDLLRISLTRIIKKKLQQKETKKYSLMNFNTIGLILDIVGVFILFFRTLPEDINVYNDGKLISYKTEEQKAKDKKQKIIAYTAFGLIMLGFFFQLLGSLSV